MDLPLPSSNIDCSGKDSYDEIHRLVLSTPIAGSRSASHTDAVQPISQRVYRIKSTIIVKFSFDQYLEEEWASHAFAFQHGIPTPSLLYLRALGQECRYFAMENVDGIPLGDCLHSLSTTELDNLALALKEVIQRLRSITPTGSQESSGVGSVNGGPLKHPLFNTLPPQRYLRSTKEFHDYIQNSFVEYSIGMGTPRDAAQSWAENIIAPFKPFDDVPTYFTHGDIGPSNIIVDPDTRKFKGLIDWGMAGWLPEYWEYCRLRQWSNGPDKPETANWEYIVEKIFPSDKTRDLVFEAYKSLMYTMYSSARY